MLSELGVEVSLPMKILSDNQEASFIANNLICHSEMKHVAMDFHFVQEKTELGILKVSHVLESQQRVDVLTKPLRLKPFQEMPCKLVGCCPSI